MSGSSQHETHDFVVKVMLLLALPKSGKLTHIANWKKVFHPTISIEVCELDRNFGTVTARKNSFEVMQVHTRPSLFLITNMFTCHFQEGIAYLLCWMVMPQ